MLKTLFHQVAGGKDGNILLAFITSDERIVPIIEEDMEDALRLYANWAWDLSISFFQNLGGVENIIRMMRTAGCDKKEIPTNRILYGKLKCAVLRVLPVMRPAFDKFELKPPAKDRD